MRVRWSYILLGFIAGGGLVTAILSEELLVRCIGAIITVASFISGWLTQQDISELQKQAKTAVHYKELDETEYQDVEEVFK